MTTTRVLRSARSPGTGILLLSCLGGLLACGGNPEAGAPGGGDPANKVAEAVEAATGEAIEKAGAAHLFDPSNRDLRKRACEFLTADMVSGLFGVPAAELQQMKVMGCIYTRNTEAEVLEARLMMIQVHRDQQIASTWFENATATKTKAQLDAEMDVVKRKVQEHDAIDTDLKKKTAANLTDVAKLGSPEGGVSYDDLPGIADAARISNVDGVIWVRLGNMTFQVAAFKGPAQPRPKFDPKNLKGIAKVAMAAQKAWVADTLAERKRDSTRLAPLVVKAINAIRD